MNVAVYIRSRISDLKLTSALQVIWKGEELWLESELRHFSFLGRARSAWTELWGNGNNTLPTLPQGPLSLTPVRTPWGSKRIPAVYIRVLNFTKVIIGNFFAHKHKRYMCCISQRL